MRALFGGSFNPVHNGHLILARDVLEEFNLSEVIFVPAYVQPLKGELLIPPEVRLRALKRAVESESYFSVWDYEIRKGGVSYTYQTLEEFRRNFKEEPVFIMGADSFLSFDRWKEPKRILELSKILILSRPGYDFNPKEILRRIGVEIPVRKFRRGNVEGKNWRVAVYDGRLLEISSTEIRKRLKLAKPIKYLVPEVVEEEIRRWENGLQEDV